MSGWVQVSAETTRVKEFRDTGVMWERGSKKGYPAAWVGGGEATDVGRVEPLGWRRQNKGGRNETQVEDQRTDHCL